MCPAVQGLLMQVKPYHLPSTGGTFFPNFPLVFPIYTSSCLEIRDNSQTLLMLSCRCAHQYQPDSAAPPLHALH